MSAWRKLAERLGIENEANWDKVAKQRNMQRYGAMDRRDKQGPMPYFNVRGTGAAQGGQQAQQAPANMTQRPGGIGAPQGTDRPGQANPLYAPPARKAASALSTAPNSPQGLEQGPEDGNQDWLNMLAGNSSEDDR